MIIDVKNKIKKIYDESNNRFYHLQSDLLDNCSINNSNKILELSYVNKIFNDNVEFTEDELNKNQFKFKIYITKFPHKDTNYYIGCLNVIKKLSDKMINFL